jgi:hypothetical protein
MTIKTRLSDRVAYSVKKNIKAWVISALLVIPTWILSGFMTFGGPEVADIGFFIMFISCTLIFVFIFSLILFSGIYYMLNKKQQNVRYYLANKEVILKVDNRVEIYSLRTLSSNGWVRNQGAYYHLNGTGGSASDVECLNESDVKFIIKRGLSKFLESERAQHLEPYGRIPEHTIVSPINMINTDVHEN